MGLISSPILLSSLASFNLLIAYYLFTAPQTLAAHHTALILGGSIQLPAASASSMYSATRIAQYISAGLASLSSSSSSASSSSPLATQPAASHYFCVDPFAQGNAASALAALFLGFFSASDLVAVLGLSNELVYHAFWGIMVPVRLAGLFALLAWLYLSARPNEASSLLLHQGGAGVAATGAMDELKNGLVFTWAFVMLSILFWTFSTLRQERHELAIRQAKKQQDQELARLESFG